MTKFFIIIIFLCSACVQHKEDYRLKIKPDGSILDFDNVAMRYCIHFDTLPIIFKDSVYVDAIDFAKFHTRMNSNKKANFLVYNMDNFYIIKRLYTPYMYYYLISHDKYNIILGLTH